MSDNPEPTNAPQTGTEPGQQAGETKPERTFTQADLDRIVKERLDKQEQSLLKKIGVSNLDEAKTAAAKLKEIEDAQKSELQKLQEKLTAAEQAAARASDAQRTALIQAAVIAEAGKQGVAQDRLMAAWKLTDTSKISMGDDGHLTGLTDAIAALLAENAFLKAEPTPPPGKTTPKMGATNPSGSVPAEDVRSWHPLYKHLSGGGFTGQVIEPPKGK